VSSIATSGVFSTNIMNDSNRRDDDRFFNVRYSREICFARRSGGGLLGEKTLPTSYERKIGGTIVHARVSFGQQRFNASLDARYVVRRKNVKNRRSPESVRKTTENVFPLYCYCASNAKRQNGHKRSGGAPLDVFSAARRNDYSETSPWRTSPNSGHFFSATGTTLSLLHL